MSNQSQIHIKNLEKYNPRKDRKKHCWVRVDNTISFSEDLDGLDPDQKWFWIFLITHASFKQTDVVEQNISYFEKHSGVSAKKIRAALDHFVKREMIQLVPRSVTTGDQLETTGSPTIQTDVTDDTDVTIQTDSAQVVVADTILNFWNSFETLPKVRTLSKDRLQKIKTRMKEDVFQKEWREIIILFSQSKFLLGQNKTGWRPGFDWFIENENNYLKILEGNYSGGPALKAVGQSHAERVFDTARDQIRRIEAGEL